jgi:hypothetical protein
LTITAKIVADSIANNIRITTLELCYHRFIHASCKTHRAISWDDDDQYELVLKQDISLLDDTLLSRNASSSRAIPVDTMLEQVKTNPAMPIHWGRNIPGMQAKEEIDIPEFAKYEWERAAYIAGAKAYSLSCSKVHKQVVNRLIEPFQFIKVIVTATEWDNFFKLRLHEDAQPEMQELARCMKEAMDNNVPTTLEHGEWHLPYITDDDIYYYGTDGKNFEEHQKVLPKISAARCARVSYLNHDNSNPDVSKDIALADKLLAAGHMSPFEHQATPMHYVEGYDISCVDHENGITHMDKNGFLWSGNFCGWLQYRQTL